MLILLLAGLLLSPPVVPEFKAAEAVQSAPPVTTAKTHRRQVAVPVPVPEESKAAEGQAQPVQPTPSATKPKVHGPKVTVAESGAPEEQGQATKPPVRKQHVPVLSEEKRRLAESEARASRLVMDNARLQQEMAKAQGLSFAEVTTPDAALAELQTGNARFVSGKRVRTLLSMQDSELRTALAKGQAPFAVIITCSDSRLADNLIFDQELGRLFTVREAGNSPDIQSLASVEYALEHLGSRLVVVLGHSNCGAVKAVYEAHGKPLPGNLWSLQAAMTGLLETNHEDPNETTADYLQRLVVSNAQRQAQGVLDRSELVRHLASAGKIKVVPALYDLASGQVKYLELPKQELAAEH
jgi:carbonic anhydrase